MFEFSSLSSFISFFLFPSINSKLLRLILYCWHCVSGRALLRTRRPLWGPGLISLCLPTHQSPAGAKIYGDVDTTRWMSLTTVFQLQRSPQDKKPQGGLCSNRNLTWGNCSYCLSLRQLWAMKLDECVWRSLLVDGRALKRRQNVCGACRLLSRGSFTLLFQYPAM